MNKQVKIIKEQDLQVANESRKKERRDQMKEIEAMNAMKEVEAMDTINSLSKVVGDSKSDMTSVTNPDIFNEDSPILKQLSYNHQQQQQQQSENQDYFYGNTGKSGGGGDDDDDDDDACDVFPGDSTGVGQMLSAGVLKHMSTINDMFVNYSQVRSTSFPNSNPNPNHLTYPYLA